MFLTVVNQSKSTVRQLSSAVMSVIQICSFAAAIRDIRSARIFSISLNSQNIYLSRGKPNNNGLFLLTIALLVR